MSVLPAPQMHDEAAACAQKDVRRGVGHKMKVLTLVDRATGLAKSMVVDDLKVSTLLPILKANIATEATVHTDETMPYDGLYQHFADHASVNHGAEEQVRGEVTTNAVEGHASIFKRGMKGMYRHCAKTHQHRYAADFAFCQSNRVADGVGGHRTPVHCPDGFRREAPDLSAA